MGNISRLERNIQGYTENTLVKIAEALGVSVADLFTENSPEPDRIELIGKDTFWFSSSSR